MTRITHAAALAAALCVCIAATAGAQDANIADGQKSFAKCRPCHQIGEGAKNIVGPELNGIVGRKAGSVAGYNYSDANRKSGLIWDEATIKEYMRNPRAKVPGTRMAFAGITRESEINNLFAYLAQFDVDGKIKATR